MSFSVGQYGQMYEMLNQITQQEISKILQYEYVSFVLRLIFVGNRQPGLDKVAGLIESDNTQTRDQLIQLHLGNMVSSLYRKDYQAAAILLKNLLCDWSKMAEDAKQEIITLGYPIRVGIVRKVEDFIDLAPLPYVEDHEYTSLYEKLEKNWNCKSQKEMSEKMESQLKTIHNTLSSCRIGDNLYRVRNFNGQLRQEPLPLYVRNEIHHPSRKERDTQKFQEDKRIAFAIMKEWL